MRIHLEQLQSTGCGLDFLKLLDNLGLHLLPLSLPCAVHDAGQEPVDLLDDALVVNARGVVVAREGHLPGELRVLTDLVDGHGHVVGSRWPSATTATTASTTAAAVALHRGRGREPSLDLQSPRLTSENRCGAAARRAFMCARSSSSTTTGRYLASALRTVIPG